MKVAMSNIGIYSWQCQVSRKVTVSPEPCFPCFFNRYWCVLPIIVVINLMHVPKLYTKRLFVEKHSDLLNPFSFQSLLVFAPSRLFNIIMMSSVSLHNPVPSCSVSWTISLNLSLSQTINRSQLFPYKVLVNVIARYISWPILSILDQRSSMHTSRFQFNDPLCYTKRTVKQYILSWTKDRFSHY